jgi:hypothetical protein
VGTDAAPGDPLGAPVAGALARFKLKGLSRGFVFPAVDPIGASCTGVGTALSDGVANDDPPP